MAWTELLQHEIADTYKAAHGLIDMVDARLVLNDRNHHYVAVCLIFEPERGNWRVASSCGHAEHFAAES